jgi:signal transduction histidine kinase
LNGGEVLIVAQPADLRPSPSQLQSVILIAAASAVVVWLLIGSYSTFSVFRPLLRVTQATARMAGGDYTVRVGARGQGEIRRLATSFDGMAQQVQQSNQVLKDFLGNVSHDLRTPLTIIAGFSQALLDGTAGPEGAEESAAVIHDEALKMQRLVDDLLQLTRLESGLYVLERHAVGVRPFVQGILERARHGRDGGPSLDNAVPAGLPPIDVDPDRLERALRNLVDNALAYTPPEGEVTVSAHSVGSRSATGARASMGENWIEISVSDTGIGIVPNDVPRVFERFYRSDRGRERIRGHSGLGLAIVREIVEAHGGQVRAESRVGQGSTFSFTVPVAKNNAPPVESSHNDEAAGAWEAAP